MAQDIDRDIDQGITNISDKLDNLDISLNTIILSDDDYYNYLLDDPEDILIKYKTKNWQTCKVYLVYANTYNGSLVYVEDVVWLGGSCFLR